MDWSTDRGRVGTLFATSTSMQAGPQPNFEANAGDGERRPAVLIVEDERIARRALAALLTASGFSTVSAESAEEALRLIQQSGEFPPGDRRHRIIALVDLSLPGMNGLDFISRLEQMDPAVFPVLMTAAGEEIVGAAVRQRNIVYLQKPLEIGRLLTVMTYAGDGL